MDKTACVRRGKTEEELAGDLNRFANGEPAACHAQPQRFPVEELGDEKGRRADAHIENGHDVRMRQRGHRPRLLLEAMQSRRVRGLRKHLDGHVTIETRVAGPVDLAHTSGPDQRVDLIRTEARACGERHGTANYKSLVLAPRSHRHATSAYRAAVATRKPGKCLRLLL